MTREYYMRLALAEARQACAEGEIPVGAVVVAGDRIVGRGHNQTEALNDVTAHAEMVALTAAEQTLGAKYLNDCTIYVTLEPCPMCAAALAWAQIGELAFAAPDAKRGYRRFAPPLLHPKTQVSCGILETEALTLVKSFFTSKR